MRGQLPAGYFLIVKRLHKQRMVGRKASSRLRSVATVLVFTTIDPIKYNLLFELLSTYRRVIDIRFD